MEQKEQKTVYTGSAAETARLFGAFDANMKIVEDTFGVTVHNRASDSGDGDALIISGDSHEAVEGAAEAVEALRRSASGMGTVSEQTALYVSSMVRDGRGAELAAFDENCICLTSKGKPVKPKTVGQRQYVESIRKNTIVLGRGSRRHGQDISCGGNGGKGTARKAGQQDNPHTPRDRGGRKARLSSRRPSKQDRPLSAPALRCAF